jgi:hypothetical protein
MDGLPDSDYQIILEARRTNNLRKFEQFKLELAEDFFSDIPNCELSCNFDLGILIVDCPSQKEWKQIWDKVEHTFLDLIEFSYIQVRYCGTTTKSCSPIPIGILHELKNFCNERKKKD